MGDWANFFLFVAASLALIVAPGPDLLYVTARGIAQGRRAGLLSAAGVTLGILVSGALLSGFFAAVRQRRGAHPAVQMMGLGLLFAAMGIVFLCFLGYFAGSVGQWLQHRPAVAARMRWVTGGIFLLLGVRLAFLDRR